MVLIVIIGRLELADTRMNTRKRSASRHSRNDTLPPPQPQPKRRTSRQGGPGRVGSVGESRPLTQDDIPRIIQGVLQSLTATSDSAPTETTPVSEFRL